MMALSIIGTLSSYFDGKRQPTLMADEAKPKEFR